MTNTTRLPTRPVLTHSVVQRMLDAAVAKSTAEGWKMHITIVDVGANMLGYIRMDDTLLLPQQVSLLKAHTAVKLGAPSELYAPHAFGDKGPSPLALLSGLSFIEGGLPIMVGDVMVGAIGVSGSSATNDRLCAQVALDAVATDLA